MSVGFFALLEQWLISKRNWESLIFDSNEFKPALTDEPQKLALEEAHDAFQVVASTQYPAVHADHKIHTLLGRQIRTLFDAIQRVFRRSSKDRKNCRVLQVRNAVVAPFAARDHPAVSRKNYAQFGSVEADEFRVPAARSGFPLATRRQKFDSTHEINFASMVSKFKP